MQCTLVKKAKRLTLFNEFFYECTLYARQADDAPNGIW